MKTLLYPFALICALFICASSSAQIVNFADSIIGFSTEYGGGWSAQHALGEPDVYPEYGDIEGAWAQYEPYYDKREYLEFYFEDAIPIDSIYIYETYNCGAVDTVYVRNPKTNQWEKVYQGTVELIEYARIFRIGFPTTDFPVSDVRIAIDSYYEDYNEIDAIAVVANSSVGLTENAHFENISVFPNPSTGMVNLDLQHLEKAVDIRIYALDGKMVYQKANLNPSLQQLKLDIAPGIYSIELKSETKSTTFKIVIAD